MAGVGEHRCRCKTRMQVETGKEVGTTRIGGVEEEESGVCWKKCRARRKIEEMNERRKRRSVDREERLASTVLDNPPSRRESSTRLYAVPSRAGADTASEADGEKYYGRAAAEERYIPEIHAYDMFMGEEREGSTLALLVAGERGRARESERERAQECSEDQSEGGQDRKNPLLPCDGNLATNSRPLCSMLAYNEVGRPLSRVPLTQMASRSASVVAEPA